MFRLLVARLFTIAHSHLNLKASSIFVVDLNSLLSRCRFDDNSIITNVHIKDVWKVASSRLRVFSSCDACAIWKVDRVKLLDIFLTKNFFFMILLRELSNLLRIAFDSSQLILLQDRLERIRSWDHRSNSRRCRRERSLSLSLSSFRHFLRRRLWVEEKGFEAWEKEWEAEEKNDENEEKEWETEAKDEDVWIDEWEDEQAWKELETWEIEVRERSWRFEREDDRFESEVESCQCSDWELAFVARRLKCFIFSFVFEHRLRALIQSKRSFIFYARSWLSHWYECLVWFNELWIDCRFARWSYRFTIDWMMIRNLIKVERWIDR